MYIALVGPRDTAEYALFLRCILMNSDHSLYSLFSSPSNLRSINAGGQRILFLTGIGQIVMRQQPRTYEIEEERLYALLDLAEHESEVVEDLEFPDSKM